MKEYRKKKSDRNRGEVKQWGWVELEVVRNLN